jgi:hypothetical protein
MIAESSPRRGLRTARWLCQSCAGNSAACAQESGAAARRSLGLHSSCKRLASPVLMAAWRTTSCGRSGRCWTWSAQEVRPRSWAAVAQKAIAFQPVLVTCSCGGFRLASTAGAGTQICIEVNVYMQHAVVPPALGSALRCRRICLQVSCNAHARAAQRARAAMRASTLNPPPPRRQPAAGESVCPGGHGRRRRALHARSVAAQSRPHRLHQA